MNIPNGLARLQVYTRKVLFLHDLIEQKNYSNGNSQ